jgi:osmotically-inducible protein OsmY
MWKFLPLLLILLVAAAAADKPPMNDAAIRDQVLIRLTTDAEVRGGELQVDVKDGVATIGGVVDEKKRKDKASKIAKKVKGVKKVINNIVIKEKGSV